MGTKEKSPRGKKVKVHKLKNKKEVEELTNKQANRISGGATKEPSNVEIPNIRKGDWVLDTSR